MFFTKFNSISSKFAKYIFLKNPQKADKVTGSVVKRLLP